jgi:hypothetical protein
MIRVELTGADAELVAAALMVAAAGSEPGLARSLRALALRFDTLAVSKIARAADLAAALAARGTDPRHRAEDADD